MSPLLARSLVNLVVAIVCAVFAANGYKTTRLPWVEDVWGTPHFGAWVLVVVATIGALLFGGVGLYGVLVAL